MLRKALRTVSLGITILVFTMANVNCWAIDDDGYTTRSTAKWKPYANMAEAMDRKSGNTSFQESLRYYIAQNEDCHRQPYRCYSRYVGEVIFVMSHGQEGHALELRGAVKDIGRYNSYTIPPHQDGYKIYGDTIRPNMVGGGVHSQWVPGTGEMKGGEWFCGRCGAHFYRGAETSKSVLMAQYPVCGVSTRFPEPSGGYGGILQSLHGNEPMLMDILVALTPQIRYPSKHEAFEALRIKAKELDEQVSNDELTGDKWRSIKSLLETLQEESRNEHAQLELYIKGKNRCCCCPCTVM